VVAAALADETGEGVKDRFALFLLFPGGIVGIGGMERGHGRGKDHEQECDDEPDRLHETVISC